MIGRNAGCHWKRWATTMPRMQAFIHHIFGRGRDSTERSHLVHIVEFLGEEWYSNLALRDALRRDGSLRARYLEVKERAAAASPESRAKYNELKGPFLAKIKAGLKRSKGQHAPNEGMTASGTSAKCSMGSPRSDGRGEADIASATEFAEWDLWNADRLRRSTSGSENFNFFDGGRLVACHELFCKPSRSGENLTERGSTCSWMRRTKVSRASRRSRTIKSVFAKGEIELRGEYR